MAETTIFNQSKLAVPIKTLEDRELPLDANSPESVFFDDRFDKFLDEIVDTLDELVNSKTTQTIPLRFDSIFDISSATEDKKDVRTFFNLLFEQINEKNPQLLKGIPPFFTNADKTIEEIEQRDEQVREFLLNNEHGLHQLRDFSQKKRDEKKTQEDSSTTTTPSTTAAEKATKTDVTAGVLSGLGKGKAQATQAEAEGGQQSQVTATQTPPPSVPAEPLQLSTIEAEKLFFQEARRDSYYLIDDVLNTYLGVDDWHSFYSQLPPEQRQLADLDIFAMREQLTAVIAGYIKTNPRLALQIATLRRVTVSERIRILSESRTEILKIFTTTLSNGHFRVAADKLLVRFNIKKDQKAAFKGSSDLAEQTMVRVEQEKSKEDAPDQPKSKVQQVEFKKQMAQILAFTALSGNADLIAENIIREFPQVLSGGLKKIDPIDLQRVLPQDLLFSIGIEQREQLMRQLERYFQHLSNAQKVELTDKNRDAVIKYAQQKKPKEAILELLKDYGIDGVAQINLLNELDGYVLGLGAPHQLAHHKRRLLDQISPEIINDPALLAFFENYILERKHFLAGYAKNSLLTANLSGTDEARQEAFSESQQLLNELSKKRVLTGNEDKVVAQALYDQRLFGSIPADLAEEDKQVWQLAEDLRRNLIQIIAEEENEFRQLQDEAARLNWARQRAAEQYIVSGADGQESFDSQSYFNDLNNAQPWNQPDGAPTNARGVRNLGGWLDKFRGLGKARSQSLKSLTNNIAKSQLRKGLLVGGAAAGAGLGIYALLNSILSSLGTLGSTLAGVGGGAAAGAIVGSFVPVVGTTIGAVIGGILGGIGGFLAGGGSGTGAAVAFKSSSSAAAESLRASVANAARAGATEGTKVLTASTATISGTTTTVAVATPIIACAVLTTITISMILAAFLPDASTTQVAPSFSLDIEESRFISVRKTASIVNSDNPSSSNPVAVRYSIQVSKKPNVPEIITFTQLTDQMSVVKNDDSLVNPPDLPQELRDQLASYAGQELTDANPINLDFELTFADAAFADSLVRNDIKVEFKANESTETASWRAQTCFGDCPQAVLPACWPTLGSVWQPPCATGTKSNPVYNPNATYSHTDLSRGVCFDAYDVGASTGTPIFAMAPGQVVYADWDARTKQNPRAGYGQVVKIDHGGFLTFYAHMSAFAVESGQIVEGGDLLGYVGSNGFSSGPHLHFEVFGLQEYIMQDLLQISGKGVPAPGPRCDEYYGKI